MRDLKRWVCGAAVLVMAGAWVGAVEVGAQARAATTQSVLGPQAAEETRREFRTLLEQFPPALGVVLKSDPTLLTNATYLATYPPLAKYLNEHPDIARNPAYFLDHVETVQMVDYR